MRRAQSSQGNRQMFGNISAYNPFNPLQSYLIENYNHKQYINSIANQRITYFLDKRMTKEDEIYRQMLKNSIATGVMADDKFSSYLQKVTKAREQSEIEAIQMRQEQIKTEQMVKSAKNLKPKNAIKHVKITQEEFAINNCAQITDQEELKKQIQQLVHVNKIKNFVQRINNKKQIKYLNKALDEIKQHHNKRDKPIKYINNENKDPRALHKPLRMPITDFKVVKLKQKPLNLSDDLTINFFDYQAKPHQIVVPKKTAEQEKIRENEVITNLGFKIRQTSEISVVAQSRNASPQKSNSPERQHHQSQFFQSRRNRNMAREKGLMIDLDQIEKQAKEEILQEQKENELFQENPQDNLFVTSYIPTQHIQQRLGSADSHKTVQQSKFQQLRLQDTVSPQDLKNQGKKVSLNQMGSFNIDSAVNSQKEINIVAQPSLTQSQLSQRFKQSNKMNNLIDQMNDYQNSSNTKNINNIINKFQNDYDKMSQQYFDKDLQQQTDLEQTLRDPEKKSFLVKTKKQLVK
ncbi:hypothetical protein TTHERM_00672010 (macronuclear) [Tetrahymena thermophila SB210]|uniref:Uncharacterized protein n=1 Tax=Tetrahymena thermophila (strain SB210) TaxID=312017 RepID=Q23E54_TETTS|nr:hypothetical protein TTHERM_00672010 [Tetrahymena thermophila SB210]EAR94733.2 hypothetical protein TTHERM_00672010 [Tetrahymena thermophila SB210]|eukprot:XP_001014978.2 hypothetical protein TTHERM_00672010 [Tetrahymena thermophila SB210]